MHAGRKDGERLGGVYGRVTKTTRRKTKGGPPPDPTRNSPWRFGRRNRRATEWNTRLMELSNRLTRYGYAKQAQRAEIIPLRLAEARMADVVFAASAIGVCYLRIRPITTGLATHVLWKPMGDGVFQMDQSANTMRLGRLVASVQEAYFDFHAMLWWGRALLDRVEGGWGEEVKGAHVDHPVGLVEFLPQHDATRVRKARDRLRRGAFKEVRDLADYSLHVFAVPRPAGLISQADEGTHILPLPDRLGKRPAIGQEFTFSEKRHVGSESDALWLGVQQFMADTFGILEAAQLRREEMLTGVGLSLVRKLREGFMPPYGGLRVPARPRRPRTGAADDA